MKILFLYETVYPDFIGGIELRNHEVATALSRRGHEVTLAGLCGSLTSQQPNLHILSLGQRGGLYNDAGRRSTRQAVRFAAKVAQSLDVRPYDVIETANMPYIHLLPLAARCAAAKRPLLVTWYEYWGSYWPDYVGKLRAPVYQTIEKFTAQLGDTAAAISELTRSRLQAARHRRHGPVQLLPCGIDVARVRAAARHDAGVGPPLIHAGRLLEHKRLDLLLHAVALLGHGGETLPRPLLTIFGEGPARPALEALAAQLGVTEQIVFRGHVRTSEEVWSEFGRARVAVQPSSREGFGLFPLEAMAAGLPVVHCSSKESAVGELVRDGKDGIEVAAEPPALAAALDSLLRPSGQLARERMSVQAQQRAAGYDWDQVARQMEEICSQLTARRRQ